MTSTQTAQATKTARFVDIHILQDLPPSCLNRDDNGTPKQARYGGATRLRVSSQSWKRATRIDFSQQLDRAELGVRTRLLKGVFADALREEGLGEDDAEALAAKTMELVGFSKGGAKKASAKEDDASEKAAPAKAKEQFGYLLFAGRRQLAELARAVAEVPKAATMPVADLIKLVDLGEILGSAHPLDVALFGRMVANMPDLNVEASVQVAHAISTHAAETQFDYFTALDDEQGDTDSGAGMLGTIEFNSATMYRFASVAVDRLAENLGGGDAAEGTIRFIESFVRSMPAGRSSTFAPRTRPSLVAVVVRSDQPVNLVSAFEAPVRSREGYMATSQERLARLFVEEKGRWGDEPVLEAATYTSASAGLEDAFGPSLSVPELLSRVRAVLERDV